ncbi:TetR/AcrR family transcriptional regulator [Pigmentiphaga soli]|uniref:TetR/AcrR family transcriptional regulator n=1 Tax=Pigmentiphaga soli TaxID=1007095 RepID=A0ABP8HBE1_9BURK
MTASAAPNTSAPKEKILKAAARLFAERGYHGIGIEDLCRALGVSRGALYHHIRSKEDLLEDICMRYMADLGEKARLAAAEEPDPVRRLERLGSELIDVIAASRAELAVCFRETHALGAERRKRVLALHAAYENVWKETLLEGQRAGVFLPFSRARLKALLGMHYYSYLWLDPSRPGCVDDAREVFRGIVKAATITG